MNSEENNVIEDIAIITQKSLNYYEDLDFYAIFKPLVAGKNILLDVEICF